MARSNAADRNDFDAWCLEQEALRLRRKADVRDLTSPAAVELINKAERAESKARTRRERARNMRAKAKREGTEV